MSLGGRRAKILRYEMLSVVRRYAITSCALVAFAVCVFLSAPVAVASDADEIEIYEHYGTYTLDAPPPDMRPIILQVPDKFRYGLSKGISRNWGVNILTYYPSFGSPEDPENTNFGLRCAGICNGRILISVEDRAHSISPSGSPNMADYIRRATMKWAATPPYPSNVSVRGLEPPDGFDEVIERVTMPRDAASNGILPPGSSVQRFLFRKADDGIHYDLAAACDVSDARTTCILHFSLACDPRVYVTAHGLDSSYLKAARDIKNGVDKFVSAMVIDPPCSR